MSSRKKIKSARRLRAEQTPSERLLWAALRRSQFNGLKFRRQHPIGKYIADFACVSKQLVIELDGGYHDVTSEYDTLRQQFLITEGWSVIRFTNEDVTEDVESVVRSIAQAIEVEFQPELRQRTESSSLIHRPRRKSKG